MPELTREDIVSAVHEALKNHPCRFDVRPKDVDHLIGMVIDIGAAATGDAEGSFRAGVEQLRKGHLWLIERLKHDEEYSANHAIWTRIRKVFGSFADKLAYIFLWGLLALFIFSLAVFGLSKAGSIKIGS